jgi:hypothetical protein
MITYTTSGKAIFTKVLAIDLGLIRIQVLYKGTPFTRTLGVSVSFRTLRFYKTRRQIRAINQKEV